MRTKEYRERTYPPPFPDGWYRVAESKEIKPGQVKHVQCLGEQIAVFRSETGQISALEAYCPHLGANLAYGEVKGDRLQCPFHGWQLDGDGKVCQPRLEQPFVHKHWEIIDYYGMVMIYHSTNGRQAPYQLPPQEKIDSGEQIYRGNHDGGKIEIHIVEFAENTVDFSHFLHVHGNMRVPWTRIRMPGVKIRHKLDWFIDDTFRHIAYMKDEATLQIRGKVYESTCTRAKLTFFGPGSVVRFELDVPGIGEITLFQTFTPLEPMKQQVALRWFAPRKASKILVSYAVGGWFSQLREDLDILRRKIYRKKPLQPKGNEGPLLQQMREWYSQFYPEEETH